MHSDRRSILVAMIVTLSCEPSEKAPSPTPSAAASASAARPPEAQSPQVRELLGRAEERLAFGDLEGAKEHLDKAVVLADRDAAVLAGIARIEAMRADIEWLGVRLVRSEDRDAAESARQRLQARLFKVGAAVSAAERVDAEGLNVLRVRVDALRLMGELDRAKQLASKISWDTSHPETQYVLAALDMAAAAPIWTLVIERLRKAVAAERGPGRAGAALCYALARSGDLDGGRRELDRLGRAGEGYPLQASLRTFIDALSGADAGAQPAPKAQLAKAQPATKSTAEEKRAPRLVNEYPDDERVPGRPPGWKPVESIPANPPQRPENEL